MRRRSEGDGKIAAIAALTVGLLLLMLLGLLVALVSGWAA